MDVVTHHSTVAGDFAVTHSRWRITGTGADGRPEEAPERE
jgi:ketosteroid isomerase-like protein